MSDTPIPEPVLSIGQSLRDRRLEKNLTTEQAAQDTKIHIKFLRALEEERWADFPARVYMEGFLKRYADYLGLPGGAAMAKQIRLGSEQSEKPGFSSPAPRENEDDAAISSGASRPLWFLAGGGAMVLVLALAYVKLEEKRNEIDHPVVPAEALAAPVAPVQPPAPVSHEIKVTAKTPVWARVWIDGQVKFEGILQPNQTKTWTALEKLRIMAGNIWLVTVQADGQPVVPKPGGAAGEIHWAKPADPAPAGLTPADGAAPESQAPSSVAPAPRAALPAKSPDAAPAPDKPQ